MAQITEASERPILKSKIFLYITEFFSGMSVPFLNSISIKAKRIACVVSAVIFVATSCVSAPDRLRVLGNQPGL